MSYFVSMMDSLRPPRAPISQSITPEMPDANPGKPSLKADSRISVEESGLLHVHAEHSLLFDATSSLIWLRQCRLATKSSIEANLPIVGQTSALVEAILRRCSYEVLHDRKRRGAPSLEHVRAKIEKSLIYGKRALDILKDLFPAQSHPKTNLVLKGTNSRNVSLIFRLRNIVAHGGSVWIDMELPIRAREKSRTNEFTRSEYDSLFVEIAALGFDLKSADGVDGLSLLFSNSAVIDKICGATVPFFVELIAALKDDSQSDAVAFHNAGILWPDISRALTGKTQFI